MVHLHLAEALFHLGLGVLEAEGSFSQSPCPPSLASERLAGDGAFGSEATTYTHSPPRPLPTPERLAGSGGGGLVSTRPPSNGPTTLGAAVAAFGAAFGAAAFDNVALN